MSSATPLYAQARAAVESGFAAKPKAVAPEPTFAESLKRLMDAWDAGTPEVRAALTARMRETAGLAK